MSNMCQIRKRKCKFFPLCKRRYDHFPHTSTFLLKEIFYEHRVVEIKMLNSCSRFNDLPTLIFQFHSEVNSRWHNVFKKERKINTDSKKGESSLFICFLCMLGRYRYLRHLSTDFKKLN